MDIATPPGPPPDLSIDRVAARGAGTKMESNALGDSDCEAYNGPAGIQFQGVVEILAHEKQRLDKLYRPSV